MPRLGTLRPILSCSVSSWTRSASWEATPRLRHRQAMHQLSKPLLGCNGPLPLVGGNTWGLKAQLYNRRFPLQHQAAHHSQTFFKFSTLPTLAILLIKSFLLGRA